MTKVREFMAGDGVEVQSGGAIQVRSGGRIFLEAGAVLNLDSGAKIDAAETQGAALTAQLSTITHTAPGTPDYALQNLVQNTGFGFATADEGNSVLKVVANLQVRLAEIEARLEAVGLVIAN